MESVLLTEGRTYAFLYLSLLKKLQRVDTMQCLLVLITDALLGSLSHPFFSCVSNMSYLDHEERISLFIDTAQVDPDLPYTPLLRYISATKPIRSIHTHLTRLRRALEVQDEFVQLKAAQILTVLLRSFSYLTNLLHFFYSIISEAPTLLPPYRIQAFLSVLSASIQGSSTNKRDVAVQCLESLLSQPDYRQEVWKLPEIISG